MAEPPAGRDAGCDSPGPRYDRVAVVEHRPVATGTWRIRLEWPAVARSAVPGQFAMLRIPGRTDPLLARPLAVYDVFAGPDGTPRYVDFLYAVHGRFTRALAAISAGDDLVAWGPLGNGFDLPATDHLLLVAGGIGQTALLALARERSGQARYGLPQRAAAPARRITFCWGARSADLFGDVDDFRRAGCEVHLATLDGSAGVQGTVIDLLDRLAASGTLPTAGGGHVATCGPEPMMAAVAGWASARGLGCHASLETPMACGVGICFTCVAPIKDAAGGQDYRRTCVEGPVFDAASIAW
ncbi:MAG: Dihydroorotate dehydrogenase electron transfer subunit [Planctomycetota bacterium]|jgi:dihydroorotate dehydrogenase electron transfer subunit